MFENLPLELKPEYSTPTISGRIELYTGAGEVQQGSKSYPGSGSIGFEWFPFPHVKLMFFPAEMNAPIALEPAKLRIPLLGTQAVVHLTRIPFVFPGTASDPIEGILNAIDSGDLTQCARLRFHLVNMPVLIGALVHTEEGGGRTKRLLLEHDPWRVTIDAIESARDGNDQLKNSGGFGITHVGIVERPDRATFSLQDCEPLLRSVGYFLSFCRGAWTHPILLLAEDENSKVLGRYWNSPVLDRYKSTFSWVPSTEEVSAHLHSAFAGFAKAWFSPVWGEAIRIGTQWHVESSTGDVEKSIVLMQAALELFAWTQLVKEKQVLTISEWKEKKNPFSAKLRQLLVQNSIPLCIPSDLTDLGSYCAANKVADGPHAITAIRNALVHPNPTKRSVLNRYPFALEGAWRLGSWYLDLCILKICGYNGRYSNRTAKGKWTGEEEEVGVVPWALTGT